eukprot:SAG11_NODE_4116_length_2059_cov_1.488265_2_plen_212_part_00
MVDDLADPDNEQFGDASNDYLVGANAKALKKKKANFFEMWHKLVMLSPTTVSHVQPHWHHRFLRPPVYRARLRTAVLWNAQVICDEKLLPSLLDWLIKLSSCKIFALRHTAAAVSMELLQACIETAVQMKKDESTAKRQLSGETKRKKKNAQKIAALEARASSLEQTLDILEQTMKELFDGVFVHRYRDVRPVIRASCMESLTQNYTGLCM